MLSKLFGGGIFGMFFALMVSMILLVVILAAIASVVIFPVFFLALVIGSALSMKFVKFASKQIGVHLDEPYFKIDIGGFIDAFQFRSDEVDNANKIAAEKEKLAMDNNMKIKRGLESLQESYTSLLNEHTVRKGFFSKRKITSDRIKSAAMTTFNEPAFGKVIADIENEKVRFEDFLI